MNTVVFIDDGKPFTCGFRLHSNNWFYAPRGRIRLARFNSSFSPNKGYGYYGDIYLRRFIRIWKNKIVLKRRKLEKKMALLCISKNKNANSDIVKHIMDFL